MLCILYRDLVFYRKVSFSASFPAGPVVKTLGFQCKVGGSLARELRSPMPHATKRKKVELCIPRLQLLMMIRGIYSPK